MFTSTLALVGSVYPKSLESRGSDRVDDVVTGVVDKPFAAQVPAVTERTEVADVRKAFERAMRAVYTRARDEAGYNATYFLHMLADLGGLGTAHRLLTGGRVSDGFTALWEKHRLDLTVEAVVLRPEFRSLFSEEELDLAEQRLVEFGYRVER